MNVIKGYQIQAVLAKGGMSTIYIAVQESLKRQVALKILNPKLDQILLDHFLDESRIIASLKHPNIIPVFDIGRVGIHFYHAMEYLEGGDLKSRIAKGINVPTALEIVLELSDALYLVHSKGIVHGDIKPANIVFRNDDCPVLTDFGISKRTKAANTSKKTPETNVLASPSHISLNYASPEVIQSQTIDKRADIYSLGIMLYEMLVGSKPYSGSTDVELAANSIQLPIPLLPKKLRSLQPLMDLMLAKDKDERIGDARMINRYIKKYLRDNPNTKKIKDEQESSAHSIANNEIVLEYVPDRKRKMTLFSSNNLVLLATLFIFIIFALIIWSYLI